MAKNFGQPKVHFDFDFSVRSLVNHIHRLISQVAPVRVETFRTPIPVTQDADYLSLPCCSLSVTVTGG
jgi:hypothetical protein